MKVLVAEDDDDMRRILKLYLQREGYDVHTVSDGESAVDYLTAQKTDLVILDWMMPVRNGIQVCDDIRLLKIPVKILMLTAKNAPENEIRGLTAGADDYIRKPFDMDVLLLRIKKLCNQESLLRFGDICMNQITHEATEAGQRLELTKTEYEILRYFLINPNRVLTREQILNQVWGVDYDGDIRTVDTHMRRLRKKLTHPCIKTSFGLGYVLEEPHE